MDTNNTPRRTAKFSWGRSIRPLLSFAILLVGIVPAAMWSHNASTPVPLREVATQTLRPIISESVIVQSHSVAAARLAVFAVGGKARTSLGIIKGVSAEVPVTALTQLQRLGVRVTPNGRVQSSNGGGEETAGMQLYPSAAVEAHEQIARGIDGRGVTIAFVDSGLAPLESESEWLRNIDFRTLYAEQSGRYLIYRDQLFAGSNGTSIRNSADPYGHGTHVLMTVADNRKVQPVANFNQVAIGVAPRSNLIMVRALDGNGQGTYADVIAAIDWIVSQKNTYNIRVLNLSLDGNIVVPYWHDPLGQAVMRAWAAGIVVVAAAGNQGPNPMTIGVPGNVPYVITVGAIKSGRYTPSGADELASYSSAGPTESKFIKPDVLVPASQTIAAIPQSSQLVFSGNAGVVHERINPLLQVADLPSAKFAYYKVSGTSMAAAEVSGIVALILQKQPLLTNDQVKHRLTSTARPAGTSGGAQYSIWQQGAGRVDTNAAVNSLTLGLANVGMNIQLDLLGEAPGAIHYMGPTAYDATTNSFYLEGRLPMTDATGYTQWAGGYTQWAGGYTQWAGGYTQWAGGYTQWAGGYTQWAGGYTQWAGGYTQWAGNYGAWAGNLEP